MGSIKNSHKISVLGAGSFGTSMAHLLSKQGFDVIMWARDPEVARDINQNQKNSRYLGDQKLATLKATTEINEAVRGRDFLLFAIPCQFLREFLQQIKDQLSQETIVVNLAKGIEVESSLTPSEIFQDVLGTSSSKHYAMLSGPNFAKEIFQEMPSGGVVASLDLKVAKEVQETLSTKFFRLYTAQDLKGVELGGALKNVMAIAVGIVEGLGFGHNARAGLITRCLHEMIELGVAMGAKERTFSGLSGIGDLILTCTGDLSRNRQVGLRLGRGEAIKDILSSMNQIAEGVSTAKSVHGLMQEYSVDMPNALGVYQILHEGMSPKQAVDKILSRELKMEFG